jgi:lipopolysaccharide assembly outer membrane protein LptD (OstA)
MRNKILIFCVIIFNSCSNREDISGIYSSSKASWSDIVAYNTKSSIGNSTLVLKKDSTYLYKTCGIFSFGTWLHKKDSLHLEIKKIEFSNAIAKKKWERKFTERTFCF